MIEIAQFSPMVRMLECQTRSLGFRFHNGVLTSLPHLLKWLSGSESQLEDEIARERTVPSPLPCHLVFTCL